VVEIETGGQASAVDLHCQDVLTPTLALIRGQVYRNGPTAPLGKAVFQGVADKFGHDQSQWDQLFRRYRDVGGGDSALDRLGARRDQDVMTQISQKTPYFDGVTG